MYGCVGIIEWNDIGNGVRVGGKGGSVNKLALFSLCFWRRCWAVWRVTGTSGERGDIFLVVLLMIISGDCVLLKLYVLD